MSFISILSIGTALASPGQSQETCYQLSKNGDEWSRTPELICIDPATSESTHKITLTTGLDRQVVATFDYSLLSTASSPLRNQHLYGIKNPSNSVFNSIAILFIGQIDPQTGNESGILKMGKTIFFYRSI